MCELADDASPLDDVLAAIARYHARPHDLDREPALIAEDMIRLRRGLDILELDFSGHAAAFAATDESDRQGALSPIGWMQSNLRMSGHAAASAM